MSYVANFAAERMHNVVRDRVENYEYAKNDKVHGRVAHFPPVLKMLYKHMLGGLKFIYNKIKHTVYYISSQNN